jgi:hypothetical protein
MVINFSPTLQAAIDAMAKREGISPESLVLTIVRQRIAPVGPIEPRDEWERRLLAIATDCGVSLPHSAVSSEGLYD